jgi:hypothetical protein
MITSIAAVASGDFVLYESRNSLKLKGVKL